MIRLLHYFFKRKGRHKIYVNPDGKLFYEDANIVALIYGVAVEYNNETASLHFYSRYVTNKKRKRNDKTKVKQK